MGLLRRIIQRKRLVSKRRGIAWQRFELFHKNFRIDINVPGTDCLLFNIIDNYQPEVFFASCVPGCIARIPKKPHIYFFTKLFSAESRSWFMGTMSATKQTPETAERIMVPRGTFANASRWRQPGAQGLCKNVGDY